MKLRNGASDPEAVVREQIAAALMHQGPSVVVLDDLTAAPCHGLHEDLEMLLSQPNQQLSVVLICSGSPALPSYLDLGSADLTTIGFQDLMMDENEVKLVLDQHSVNPTEQTIRAILEHTVGWAHGVRLAALSLQRSESLEAALRETDEQIRRFLDNKIISRLAPATRDMIAATSIAEEVPAELAYAMAADKGELLLESMAGYDGFIDLRSDGSFRCHPLIRRAAFARLSRRSPSTLQSAYRQAAQWHAERGDPTVAIELAMKGGDWAWAARALLRSLVVPRMLAGAGGEVVKQVLEVKELGESEPLLLSGAALAHAWFDIAESALARAQSALAQAPQAEMTEIVSLALLNMATSRQRGEPDAGLAHARHLKEVMGKLTVSERALAPELLPLIDYYVAGFELSRGHLATARSTLQRGAGRFPESLAGNANYAEQLARADCSGQLSWLDAFCGDLRRATRCATSLLTDRQADSGETGVRFAHLATAWTHLERGEVGQARQRLDHALSTSSDSREPLLAAAEMLTQARLAIDTGEPETALRLLQSIDLPRGWFADQILVLSAEAWLAAGEPQRAIATLTPEPDLAPVEARLILARAFRSLGDLRTAETIITRVPSDPAAISLIAQVQCWLLRAGLAVEQGDHERAEVLVDRALRAAAREQLRTTVASAGAWLRSFVARDSGLSGRHSAFLASIAVPATTAVDHLREEASAYDELFVVPLTVRETEVLKLLAEFCSNEEIAADLFLSLNTVKTHMRSLFQKLSVTRRADAVRRGRALGLC
jgi:LuxR family maltose regulon positive regulatory protein